MGVYSRMFGCWGLGGSGHRSESANSRGVVVVRQGRRGSPSQEPGLAEGGLLSSAVREDRWTYPQVLLSPWHWSNITDKAGLPLL